MSVKRLLFILLICGALFGGVYIGGMILLGSFSLTKGEKLSDEEWELIERLESRYKCDIKITHNSKAIDPNTEDSTVYVTVSWVTKGNDLKDSLHDIAIKSDSNLIDFSTRIAMELFNLLPDKQFYKNVSVSLQDISTYDGTIRGMSREVNLKHTLIDGRICLMGFDKRDDIN